MKTKYCLIHLRAGVFNLLSSRANLRLSYNPASRIRCRLQNHHGYMKHHHRGMGGLPGDLGEVPMMQVKQWKGCRMSCTYITAHSPNLLPLYLRHSSFYSPSVASHTSQALHLRHSLFYNPSAASSTQQLILQPFRRFSYVTGHSTTLPLLHLCHRHFTYFTWRAAPPLHDRGMKKQSVVDQLVTTSY